MSWLFPFVLGHPKGAKCSSSKEKPGGKEDCGEPVRSLTLTTNRFDVVQLLISSQSLVAIKLFRGSGHKLLEEMCVLF
uniref:Uncharacterized protein n=1 Tax=Arundo donax TaxID=35708 RepID=A0A0A9H038_ARUDO